MKMVEGAKPEAFLSKTTRRVRGRKQEKFPINANTISMLKVFTRGKDGSQSEGQRNEQA